MATCKDCAHKRQGSLDPATMKRDTVCMRNPPVAHLLQQGHGIATVSVYPPVSDEFPACGEHKTAIDLNDHH